MKWAPVGPLGIGDSAQPDKIDIFLHARIPTRHFVAKLEISNQWQCSQFLRQAHSSKQTGERRAPF